MAGINYSFPFKRSSQGGFVLNESTLDAVIDDLKILLISNHGERPVHGDFGANLRSVLFDQSSGVIQKAEDLIITAIEKWMPFVRVLDITVDDENTNVSVRPNELKIILKFEVGQIEGVLEQRIRN